MFSENNYQMLIGEFNKKLKEFHGQEMGTYVEDERFTLAVDKQRIIATTKSSGNPQRIQRTNAEAALHALVSKGCLTKTEMEKMKGLSSNKATKLFAIIAHAHLLGVTATDIPERTLKYRA